MALLLEDVRVPAGHPVALPGEVAAPEDEEAAGAHQPHPRHVPHPRPPPAAGEPLLPAVPARHVEGAAVLCAPAEAAQVVTAEVQTCNKL